MTTKPLPASDPEEIGPAAVVIVPFPYADRLAEKRRPALVVSNRTLADAGLLWVIMITTAKRGLQPFDIAVDPAVVGLPVPCVVRPTKIACIEPSRVLRVTGVLGAHAAEEVFAAVRGFVGPHRPRFESSRHRPPRDSNEPGP
jgi:mRNA interferase MazF